MVVVCCGDDGRLSTKIDVLMVVFYVTQEEKVVYFLLGGVSGKRP